MTLKLGLDCLECFGMEAAAFGDGFEQLGESGEITDQFILASGLAHHVLADFVHELGERLKSILEMCDGRGVFSPGAKSDGLSFEGHGRILVLSVVGVAVWFCRAFEQTTDTIEKGFGFGHVSLLALFFRP